MIDGHGDDLWRYAGKVRHNFSTNIHSAFDHSPLMAHIASSAHAILSYPEPEPVSVEKKISGLHSCNQKEVMVTNGATEAIYMIAKEFSGAESLILGPTFREYQDACKMYGHKVTFTKSLDTIPDKSQLIWLCNPNNPTGKVTPLSLLWEIIHENTDKVFVIDQAYSDYTLLPTLNASDVIKAGNVIMLGSLTKRFAVPGLRIGYAIGSESLIARIKKWRMPWSVNGIAVESAKYLIDNIGKYDIDAEGLHKEALRISGKLWELGIEVENTDCNFILCKLPDGTASELKQYLMDEGGILIRDASNFEGLTERHFRVAAQSRSENDMMVDLVGRFVQLKLHKPC
ncbi:MAG: aminotransferase class I/II-fold pyridoxal phosphate-dependent enzyme [Muribaculum sp.]|nr:aminotransferase class I/II-fold pyridoxal phosphate-dependent enzyme [Muribaculum sp.]